MNEVMSTILARQSCRSYKPDMPAKEDIDQIIEAGLWAATGGNCQSPIIVEITNKELRDRVSAMNAAVMGLDMDPFYGAPVVLVVLADRKASTHVYDGSLAMGNMMLAASSLGLGSCWIHRAREVFDSDEGKAILADLGVEGDYEGIGNLIVGIPAAEPGEPKPRNEGRVFIAE